MRNQYKVLQEKYELQVEVPATREERAIYNTKALTKDFLPTAIKIYKDQVEPIIKSWPDFDIMTDTNFNHNIIINASNYGGAAIIVPAGWSDMYVYYPRGFPPMRSSNVDDILERWFVYYLSEKIYSGYGGRAHPKSFSIKVQKGLIPPQKSNADFIQYLIKLAVIKMRSLYDINHRKAEEDGSIKRFRAIKDAQTQHTKTHGINLNDW